MSANLASNLAVGLEKTWCIEVPVWPWTNTGKQWQIPTMFGQMLMFESQSLNGLETSETRQTLKNDIMPRKDKLAKVSKKVGVLQEVTQLIAICTKRKINKNK